MVMIPQHLMQSIETEHLLTAPAQLTTLTRLDQDMKQIMDSSFPEDQKVLLDQLLRRDQGLTKQMKSEITVKPVVVLPKSEQLSITRGIVANSIWVLDSMIAHANKQRQKGSHLRDRSKSS